MAMNRILEFTPSAEEAVVSRILVLVHQTVDECFPATKQANRQFTKTLFSDDNEQTAIGNLPENAALGGFGEDVITASNNRATSDTPPIPKPPTLPPPPRPSVLNGRDMQASAAPPSSPPHAMAGPLESKHSTALDEAMAGLSGHDGPDWGLRLTILLLVAGLALLGYALFY